MEIWNKFRLIFQKALSCNTVDIDEERSFLSLKGLVNSRYDDLMDSFGVKPIGRFIKSESIYNILSLENLSTMSDERYALVERDWEESLRFLDSLLERLERKKRRIGGFNKFIFLVKNGINRL